MNFNGIQEFTKNEPTQEFLNIQQKNAFLPDDDENQES